MSDITSTRRKRKATLALWKTIPNGTLQQLRDMLKVVAPFESAAKMENWLGYNLVGYWGLKKIENDEADNEHIRTMLAGAGFILPPKNEKPPQS